jgi:hypothetical protein
MNARYLIAISYWAFWMLLGWGTFAIVTISRRFKKQAAQRATALS